MRSHRNSRHRAVAADKAVRGPSTHFRMTAPLNCEKCWNKALPRKPQTPLAIPLLPRKARSAHVPNQTAPGTPSRSQAPRRVDSDPNHGSEALQEPGEQVVAILLSADERYGKT